MKAFNFTTRTLFLFWIYVSMQSMSTCDELEPLPGFEGEPFIRIISDSSFKVYYTNDMGTGDTLRYNHTRRSFFSIPFDMHANTMHYAFFQNDSYLGKLTLNYSLLFSRHLRGESKYYLIQFDTVEVDSSSDFRNLYGRGWGLERDQRIDSIGDLGNYFNGSYYPYLKLKL